MRPFQTPFQTGWFSINLPHYREYPYPRRGTYNYWPYQNLPSLSSMRRWMSDQGQGSFAWLQEHGKIDTRYGDFDDANSEEESTSLVEWKADVNRFLEGIQNLEIVLPPAYETFLSSPDLLLRVRSCTDCYFDLPAPATAPFDDISPGDQTFLLRFLSDSQDCYHWYLYLTSQGEHCVVSSRARCGGMFLRQSDLVELDWAQSLNSPFLPESYEEQQAVTTDDFWYCGANFEAFLFRFWMENEIWYSLAHDKIPLTPPQQLYAEECLRLNHDFNQSLLESD